MNENTISSFTSQVPYSSSSSSAILPQSVILSQMPQTEELAVLSHENLEKFEGQIQLLRRNGVLTNRGVFIHEDVKDIIPFKLKQTGVTDWDVWERWTDERFFMEMLKIYTKETATALHEGMFLQTLKRLSQVDLVIDYRVEDSEIPYVSKIKKILRETQFERTITDDESS